ncbi:MAG: class I SAM-dependent methyltransferase [Acidobacteria bacterium]|nr:class I SAM-dependent methyltransferase [Acidobacteriota bacterium]
MSQPSPLKFMEAVNGHQKTAVACAAIELEIFTRIAEGLDTVDPLAAACGCAPRGMRILLDALTVLDLLQKHEGRYCLTRDSAIYLDRRSPEYLGDSIEFSHSPFMQSAFLHFTGAVRAGGAVTEPEGTMAPEHPVWVQYARAMTPLAMPQARKCAEVAGPVQSVLDIAAGHGMFGISILQQSPQARCLAVDWANILALALENAARAGVSARYETRPGSAFDVDLGAHHDLALLPNILHHFHPEGCHALLRRVCAALRPGGRLFVVEMIPHEDRVHPSAPAWFATMMLATTPAGDAYTLSEYSAMLHSAGFSTPELHPIPGSARTLLVSIQ